MQPIPCPPAILLFAFCVSTTLLAASSPRPNFVFILADDLGYSDLGCYGATDIKTPNIDRLATEGVRFTQFYANGPVCTPTRCGLMTGRYQQRIGGLEWAIPPGKKHLGLPAQEKTLATMLRETGYATALSGKWHLGYTTDRAPNAHGFDYFFGLLSGNHDYFTHRENNGEPDLYLDVTPVVMDGYSTHLITRHALQFLETMKDKPFFLYLAYNAPHFPFQAPEDAARPVTLKGWAMGSRETYSRMVETLDAGVGEVLTALDRHGLTGNTLVVFASDNGGDRYSRNEPLAKGKGQLWEGGIRVPCLVRWPGQIPAGKQLEQTGIMMDWTVTIAQLAGAVPPTNRPFDGLDLAPFLAGKRQPVERTLFWRRVGPDFVKTHRAVRCGDWKLIETAKGEVFLYDLAREISEATNLAKRDPERVGRLRALLDAWEDSVDPPLYAVEPR